MYILNIVGLTLVAVAKVRSGKVSDGNVKYCHVIINIAIS